MLPRLLHFVAAVVVVLTLSLPFAVGQQNSDPTTVERGVKLDPASTEKSTGSSPVFAYFVMIIYTFLVLTIVCMPSRKA